MASEENKPDKVFTRDFILILLVNFTMFLSFQLYPSTLPIYAVSIGVNEGLVGLIAATVTLSTLLVRPFIGVAMDRWGRKGFLISGTVGMIICTALLVTCPLFGVLLTINFIRGLFWGVAGTATSTVVSDILPKKRFGEGMGYFGLSVSVAMAIGPALGLAVIGRWGLPQLAVLGAVIMIVCMLLQLPIRYIKIDKNNIPPKQALFEKGALVPAAAMFFITCVHGAIITYVALTAASRGVVGGTGMFFTIYALAAIACRLFIGKLIDRKGFFIPGTMGMALMLLADLAIMLAPNLPFFLFAGVLYGVGQGTTQTTLQSKSVLDSPPNRKGAASATFMFGFDAGIGVGSLIAGALVAGLSYTGMFAVMALFPVIAFVILFIGERRGKKRS